MLLSLLLALNLAVAAPTPAEQDKALLLASKRWTGDLDGMVAFAS